MPPGGRARSGRGAGVGAALRAATYVVCYALWLVTMALGIVDVIVLRRFTEWAYVALAFDKWGLAWVSHSVTIAAGLAWLALVAWSETAYRAGVAEGRLWRRFGVVTLVELAPLSLLLWELALS